MAQPFKPFLWLDKNNLKLKIFVPGPANSFSKQTMPPPSGAPDVEITYIQNNGGQLNPGTVFEYGTLPQGTTSVKVILKDNNGNTIGFCTLRTSNGSSANDSCKPFVWLGATQVHYCVPSLTGGNDKLSDQAAQVNGLTDSITGKNRAVDTDSENWGLGITGYNPAAVNRIDFKVYDTNMPANEVGESTSNTGDADGSGGNDLLDDFFD